MLGPVAVVAVLAGCAAPPPAGPPPVPAPAPLVEGVEPAPSGPPEPMPIDAAPLDATTVPGCGSGCEVRFEIALPDGGRFAGVQGTDAATGAPTALLVRRTAGGEVRTAEPVPDASVTEGVCDAQRCVTVLGAGADTGAVVVDVDDLTVTGRAAAGAPGARPIDLDGDDRVDLALPLSAGAPGDAAVLWQTWRQTTEGALELTGCGPAPDAEQAPAELQAGPCPAT